MRLVLIAALLILTPQDALIDKLASDSIEERDAASAELERLGVGVIPSLKKAREKLTDAEVRARLDAIISTIGKRAEFSKVFGATKRATIAAKGRAIGEITTELATSLGETIELEGIDAKKAVDLVLKNATLWESLDALAKAANAHYDYGETKVVFRAGAAPAGPVLYAEQFRVSIAEFTRIDCRSAGSSEQALILVAEIRHQRNLKPAGDAFRAPMKIEAVKDAKGEDALSAAPSWTGTTMLNGRPFAQQEHVYLRPDAPGPFTIQGTTDVLFAVDIKEIRVPLDGAKMRTEGAFSFTIDGFTTADNGSTLTMTVAGTDHRDFFARLQDRGIIIASEDGGSHVGHFRGGAGMTFTFVFPTVIKGAKSVVIRWAMDFHRVQLPFRLEGIKAP